MDVNQRSKYTGFHESYLLASLLGTRMRVGRRTYWGEYPLSFAACTNQMDCVRLLRAKKADPNRQDTNGNTVLHLMVIHENKVVSILLVTLALDVDKDGQEMFDFIHSVGGRLHTRNNQNLSPLNLAAMLAKKVMFDHVLQKERDVLWVYKDIVCAAYPLKSPAFLPPCPASSLLHSSPPPRQVH